MKPFAWSFSKLKSFETCPKKHYEVDIARNYKEESEQLTWGNYVHKALENAILGKATLPPEMAKYQKWVVSIQKANGKIEVEKQFALNKDFLPVPYFDREVWYRGKADVVVINGDTALAFDWKTGKIQKDSVQLMLMAQCIFAHYPQVQRVTTFYVWLQENAHSEETFDRQEVANAWIGLLLRVKLMQEAYDTQTYQPKPSGLCRKHCPVVSCPFHGKGARG